MPSPATHLRAPLLWLLLPLLAGLTAAKLWPPPSIGLGWGTALAGALSLVAAGCAFRPTRYADFGWPLSLSLTMGLVGFIWLQARYPQLHALIDRPAREVTVTFEVLQLFSPTPTARSLTGLGVIISAGAQDRELIGRRIYFSAIRKISLPPRRAGHYLMQGLIEPLAPEAAAASFNDYLTSHGVRQKLTRGRILREVRPPGWFIDFCNRAENHLETILQRGLEHHPQTRSLYLGMLLGEKAVLSQAQQNAFMRSGTFHIFSVSGLHVGVIALSLHSLFRLLRLPQRLAAALCLPLLWLYVQITGASSPAERSFLMIAFLYAAQIFRLPQNPLAALAGAALMTVLLEPLQLFSTGFQMSYAVVVALVVMGIPLSKKWTESWQPYALIPRAHWRGYQQHVDWGGRELLSAGAVCWVAFLASTPSGIGYFQTLSPGSLVANLIIIPISSLALVAGFLALLTGLVGLSTWSILFNSAAALILILMDWLVQQGIALPGMYYHAQFVVSWLAPASLVGMTTVMLAGLAGKWSPRYGGFWPPVLLLALLLLFGVNFD